MIGGVYHRVEVLTPTNMVTFFRHLQDFAPCLTFQQQKCVMRPKNAVASRLGSGCPELDDTAGGEDGCNKHQYEKVCVCSSKETT